MKTSGYQPRPRAHRTSVPTSTWTGVAPRWVLDPLRQLGKRVFNPLLLTFSGRLGPYAVVRHVGRRSGRAYATPVVAASLGDDFIIPLPFGGGADWCRNIEAAGGCTLLRSGVTYSLTAPDLVDQRVALPAFPAPARLAARLLGIRWFLRLRRVAAG